MIEGKSLARSAQCAGFIRRRRSRWRHRFLRAPSDDKPRRLSGIVEADETFILESFKGRWSDLPRKARKRGGTARHPGPYQDNIPVLVARDRKGATLDAVLPQADGASIAAVLTGIVTPSNHLVGDGGKPLAAFARKAGIPFHSVPSPGKPTPQAPHLHINNVNAYHSRLKQWLSRFNGVATKNLPSYLGWRAPSKPGASKSIRQAGSTAQSAMGHTNRQRYKSRQSLSGNQKSGYDARMSHPAPLQFRACTPKSAAPVSAVCRRGKGARNNFQRKSRVTH